MPENSTMYTKVIYYYNRDSVRLQMNTVVLMFWCFYRNYTDISACLDFAVSCHFVQFVYSAAVKHFELRRDAALWIKINIIIMITIIVHI